MMADTDDHALGVASPGVDRSLALEAHGSPDVAVLRRSVAEFLGRSSVPSSVVDDVELLVSELVTNAIVHGSSGDAVRVRVQLGESIDVAVSNRGSAAAVPPVEAWRVAAPSEMSGRGLGIVRRLSDDAAIRQDGDWVVVTCRRHRPDGRRSP